jgi:NADPH2:quinone reductase
MQITDLTGPAGLRLVEVEEPTDAGVLIDVHATGVSFPDLLLSKGEYQDQPTLPFIPGVDVAGIVRSAPSDCGLHPGDRVAAYVRRGGWAEAVRCPAEFAFPLPARMSFADGTALPLNYLTAHLALTRRARLTAGESVLVLGGAGGIGTAAIQVANGLGARTIAVTSSPDKAAVARLAGAHEVVSGPSWAEQVRDLTGETGLDIVVDPVGGEAFATALRLTAREGRVLVIGFASGSVPSVRVNRLLLRNVDLRGVAWGPTVRAEPGYAARQWSELMSLESAGHIRPVLGRVYDLGNAAEALTDLGERAATGKLTLRLR